MFPLDLPEAYELQDLLKLGYRSIKQQNTPFSSDSELVFVAGQQNLAISIDSLSEEIQMGLYQDPYTWGWVAACQSLSDVFATGVVPLGVLFSANWGPEVDQITKKKVFSGLYDCLMNHGAFLLGGDRSQSKATVLSTVGVGLTRKKYLNRQGISSGDYLVVSQELGSGAALAYRWLLGKNEDEFLEQWFRPFVDRLAWNEIVPFAKAMIDASDGYLAACTTLAKLNQLGFKILWDKSVFSERVLSFCKEANIPLWALWVAEHGGFELCYVIDEKNIEQVLLKKDLNVKILGQFTSQQEFSVVKDRVKSKVNWEEAFLVSRIPEANRQEICANLFDKWRTCYLELN